MTVSCCFKQKFLKVISIFEFKLSSHIQIFLVKKIINTNLQPVVKVLRHSLKALFLYRLKTSKRIILHRAPLAM